ncbi:MAG: glycosyl hydrolase-related protein [Planctomycetota bacterium]
MTDQHTFPNRFIAACLCAVWLAILLAFTVTCQATERGRQWTVYLAQDKHLDYNWCGSTTEIELRMVGLVDYFVDAAERNETCWNLDGTLWDEVYRRHRGKAGSARLHNMIRRGRIGYTGNYAVLLWGILDTETAIRACYGAIPIEESTSVRARTALVMENPGLTWGIATILTDCGFNFLGRGIYRLRAESYNRNRDPYPLFWWKAPNGKRILVRWDLYQDTKSWGGYAEAYCMAAMAGEKWNAFQSQSFSDRNTDEVFRKRKQFIHQTIKRYEAYGENYPISSIMLLGTGWDNWTQTKDFSTFVRKFNADSDGTVRIIDGRYEDFFLAAEWEIREKNLSIPTLEGSFGICWEEWAAHLAGPTAEFREAERLLRLAEASQALATMTGRGNNKHRTLLRQGFTEVLKFAEHDFGGTDRQRAALSAGARASAVTQAMDIGRSLAPKLAVPPMPKASGFKPEKMKFEWRGGSVVFDPHQCSVVSLTDAGGREWVPKNQRPSLGEFKHTLYRSRAKPDSVFPGSLPISAEPVLRRIVCRRASQGVQIMADFEQSGFQVDSKWFFHAANPWIDVTYRLKEGWSDDPQTVEFCFPFAIENPTYRYDAPGTILKAGPKKIGGDDLPGANPELFAGVTFAAASGGGRTVLLLTPDSLLLRFGRKASKIPAKIISMPMMNLTGNDWQFGQGGRNEWTFRYRIVLFNEKFNSVRVVQEAQQFVTPPFLQVPGQPPVVSGLEALGIKFSGGPLLAFKIAEDNQRLILRFWNVLNRTVQGSLRLPPGWSRADICDALERTAKPLDAKKGTIRFSTEPLEILTIALAKRN